MTTVLLVRHGRTTANAGGVLAGWTPGVELDERGSEQAAALAARLTALPLNAVVSSPLERCLQTAGAIVDVPGRPAVVTDERFAECRYGDWTGRELKTLVKEPLWQAVQLHPSAAAFPGADGEAMRDMQVRAVAGVRDWNARLDAEHGGDALYVVCSHGDVIKAIVADALGMHLDLFQRIVVDPCSLTAIRYTPLRPFLLRLNDVGGGVEDLKPPKRRGRRGSRRTPPVGGGDGRSAGGRGARRAAAASDAVVGGGAGAA